MHVPPEARDVILRELGGAEDECALVCNVIEAACGHLAPGRDLAYDVKRMPGGAGDGDTGGPTSPSSWVRVRLAAGIDIFTSAHAKRVLAVSRRVQSVQLLVRKGQVHVRIAGPAASEAVLNRRPTHEPACARPRLTAIDYAAGSVTDRDDILLMDAVVSDVYNMARRMPDTRFWFEPIAGGGGGGGGDVPVGSQPAVRRGGGGPDPSEDDASESVGGLVPEAQRVGYALCFANVPDVDSAFFQYLHDRHGPRVAAVFAWLSHRPPLLVVNVRRATVAGAIVLQNVQNHLPRPPPGLPGAAPSKHRLDADDGSVGERGKRAKR